MTFSFKNGNIVSIDTKKRGENIRIRTYNTSKYTNHTKEEIKEYLKAVKKSVNAGNFIVCTTKKNEKNLFFTEEYRLTKNKQKQMLVKLEVADFCYSADNYNHPKERLYLFCREYELDHWGSLEKAQVYVKIAKKQDDLIVVVSFHKPEKSMNKLFL